MRLTDKKMKVMRSNKTLMRYLQALLKRPELQKRCKNYKEVMGHI